MKRFTLSLVLIILLILTLTCVLFACTVDPDSDSGTSGTPSGTVFDDLDTVDSVSRITVTALKDTYYLGEALDRSSYVVKVILTDGSIKTIPMTHPSVKIEGYNPYVVGETTFTVRYGQATYACTVNIVAPELESISIVTLPEKTTYVEGDELNLKGATLRLTLVTGPELIIDLNAGFVSGYRKDLVGEQTVTVDYAGKTASFTVTVLKKTLSSVRLESNPDKREYLTGDELIKEGLSLKFVYDNGDSAVYSISELKDFSSEYNAFCESYQEESSIEDAFADTLDESGCFFSYDFTLPDNNTPVRLYYLDIDGDARTLYSTTFYCSVALKLPRENQAVEIKSQPNQLREDSTDPLIEGGVIDYTGGSITVHYQDGSSEDFDMADAVFTKTIYTSDGSYTVTDTSTAGTYLLRFSYYRNDSRGWYADMTFTVRKKTPTAVRFVNTDGLYAADYYVGLDRELNYNDLKYVVDYNNGTTGQPIAVEKNILTDGTDFSTLTVSGDYVTGEDGRRYKNKPVKISPLPDYPALTAELTVRVYEHLITSLTVISAPDNIFLSATATTIRELSGLSLRARYNSGYEKTIYSSDVTPIFSDGTSDPSLYVDLANDVTDGTAELAAYIEHPDTTTEVVAAMYRLTLTVGETCSSSVVLPTYAVCFTSLQPSATVSVLTQPSLAYIKGDTISLLGQRFEIDLGGNHTLEVTTESNVSDTVTFTSDDLNKIVLKKSLYLSTTSAVATGRLRYNFFGTTFSDDIIVTPIRLSGLEVTSNGSARTDYSVGEAFSTPDGIVVTVIKNNGTRLSYTPTFVRVDSASDIVGGGFYFVFSDSVLVEGKKTVSLYYREGNQTVSATWQVHYVDDALTLKGIELYRGDQKYDNASSALYEAAAGLNLNLGEFSLRLEYTSSGGSVYKNISLTSEMTDYDFADNTLGERMVKIYYAGHTIDWKINVVSAILTGITLDVSDMRLDYVSGQNLDYSGGYVVRHYGAALSSDRVSMAYAKVTGFDSDVNFEEGVTYVDRTVYVEYGGYSANFTVRIWNRSQPSIRFVNVRQRVDDTFKDETTFEFIRTSESFADPSYRIYFDFADAYGNWISIAANGAYYEYVVDGVRYEYYSADLLPHHVGTYRIRVVCAENDYYEAATFTSEYYIQPTTVTLRINSATISYGDQLPELGFVPTVSDAWNYVLEKLGVNYSGAPASDGVTDVSALAVGKYEDLLGIGTLSHPYFYITVEKGTLVVNPRTIVVKVDNAADLRYDDGADLYDRIRLSVSYGDFSTSGGIEDLDNYFTVEEKVLSDVGVYTLSLTSTAVDGKSSYVLTDSDGAVIDSITIEVKKALRVLEVSTVNVSVVKNADGSHTFTMVGFDSYPDAEKIEWVLGTTGGNWRSVTDDSEKSITVTFSDSDSFVYLYFRYSYAEDDTYESTNAVPLIVELV